MILIILIWLICIGAAAWGFLFFVGTLAQYTKNNTILTIIAWTGFGLYFYALIKIGIYFSNQF